MIASVSWGKSFSVHFPPIPPADVDVRSGCGGQVERMNRTIKDATAKRQRYDSPEQLRSHLADFLDACNLARGLKTLSGLTPCEYICKIWTAQPDRFILNPIQQMPGLST